MCFTLDESQKSLQFELKAPIQQKIKSKKMSQAKICAHINLFELERNDFNRVKSR